MTQIVRIQRDTFLRRFAVLVACLGLAIAVGCKRETLPKGLKQAANSEEEKQDDSRATSGREALNRLIIAYRKASSYSDAGTVRLLAEAGDQKIDQTSKFSVALVQPDKLRVLAYQAMLVCDGKKMYAAIESIPNQVLVRQAPLRVNMKMFRSDPNLAMAIADFAGPPPQLMLLFGDEPSKALLRDAEEPVLLEPRQIDGRDCYRVQITRPEGVSVFWIDQETFLLRRIVFPTDELRQSLTQDKPLDKLSLVAEFSNAQFNGKVDPKAFQFQVPEGAEIVKFFLPPHAAQLLSKKVPDFKFYDLDGKPITPESLAGKVSVLDFWATWCGPCKQSLPNLQKVYEQYKGNAKVAFYAISIDAPAVENKALVKTFEDLKVQVPIVRDTERSAAAFKFTGIPTTFIIGADGVVQDYEAGGNPKLAEELPEKIGKLLAGESIYEKPLKAYQERLERYAKSLEKESEGEPAADRPVVEEQKLPEAKTAQRSEPTTMKLAPLWKCAEVKSPGNVLVLGGTSGPARLAVIENWKSVAEVGLDGKRIALHKLNLAENEVIGNLRSAVGADGRRYTVAFMASQQRCHVLDDAWNPVTSYPEGALKNTHSGIADVELGDLDGDGKLEMYVSYWGVVGVQAVSLEGKRLWANRSLSNVLGMAIGAPDEKGRRNLYCTNSTGSLVVLDAQGQRQGEIRIPDRMLHWIVAADLRGDGQRLWCGMAAPKLGENLCIGLSLKGEELWNYLLPPGIPPPVEWIVAGRIARGGPGQWILPGPDGSIHIISADGKLLDKFNYGAMLQGLATVEIDGQPALVVSSANGLEAWKVK